MKNGSTAKNQLTLYATLLFMLIIPLISFKTYIGGFPLSAEVLLLPLLLLVFLYEYRTGRLEINTFPIKYIMGAFLLFLLVSVVSLTQSQKVLAGVMELMRYISYIILFFIVAKTRFSKVQFHCLCRAGAAVVLLVGAYGILQYLLDINLNTAGLYTLSVRGRVYSTMTNPNYYGAFVNMMLPTALLLAVVYYAKRWQQLAVFSVFALLVINLVLTYTRGSWISIVPALILAPVLIGRRFVTNIFKPHLLLAFVLLFVFVLNMPDVVSRSDSAGFATRLLIWHQVQDPGGEGNSGVPPIDNHDPGTARAVFSRVKLWQTAFMMYRENLVLGVGIGNYMVRYQEYVTRFPDLDMGHEAYSAHNSYLKIMAETGTVGILAFLSIYLIFYLYCLSYYRFFHNTDEMFAKVLLVGLIAGSLTFMLQNNTNNLFFIPQQNLIFWLASGLIFNYLHEVKVSIANKAA